MSAHSLHPPRRTPLTGRRHPAAKKSAVVHAESGAGGHSSANGNSGKLASPDRPPSGGSERTVKKLRLSKALTIPEGTLVLDACRRMTHRRVDAALLTDSNGLLCGIVTDKDIAARVIAEGLKPEETFVSKIMTRNPIFVASDTLAIEALQKMVQGKFRHLPVVENSEVVALLDITKCLYDAISRMEKIAEQGSAIAAAVEGVERHWGNNFHAQYAFIETLRERMFKPSLSTIVTENTKVATVLASDPVYLATKRMREHRVNSVVIVAGGKPQGILTSKDILMRVAAQHLSPELTLVEKVMTANPECATLNTTILDALHLMHDGMFLHLPVVDHDGRVVACLDVLQITHAVISMVDGGAGAGCDTASMMMQKFWDSALHSEPADESSENHSELSLAMTAEAPESGKFTYPHLGLGNSFTFKVEDQKNRVHRFSCGAESLPELINAIKERIGPGFDQDSLQLTYEDDEGDKVLLVTDNDLIGAVYQARSAGWKALRLHLDNSDVKEKIDSSQNMSIISSQKGRLPSFQASALAGAISLTSIGIMIYLKRSK